MDKLNEDEIKRHASEKVDEIFTKYKGKKGKKKKRKNKVNTNTRVIDLTKEKEDTLKIENNDLNKTMLFNEAELLSNISNEKDELFGTVEPLKEEKEEVLDKPKNIEEEMKKRKKIREEKRKQRKKQAQKENKKNTEKVKKPKKKGIGFFKIIKVLFILGCMLAITAGIVLYAYLNGMFGNKATISKDDIKIKSQTTVIYSRDGKEIARLSDDEKRTVVTASEMSEYIPKAYVSIEDERFEKHRGVDLKRTLGAIYSYVIKRRGDYGGSTITQQLIKNLTKDDERSWKRKVREIKKAIQFEKQFSKDEILELYLNLMYVGGRNVHGIELGSDLYFSKKAKDLSLAESAFMAGINNSPNSYWPFEPTGVKVENGKEVVTNQKEKDNYDELMARIKRRTKTVLVKMHQLGKITEEEKKKAIEEVDAGLKFKKGNKFQSTVKYNHLVDAAIDEFKEHLMSDKDKEVSPQLASMMIKRGGYKIYTTCDNNIQNKVEAGMKTEKYSITSRKYKDENGKSYLSQAATVVIDHKTGEVLAAVGGLNDEVKMTRGDWNRITMTKRQPGSSIKPIVDIAPALESGKFTAASVILDEPINLGGWRPQNYSRRFYGNVTLRYSIVKSLNIPQIKILREVGAGEGYKFLNDMDFDLPKEDNENLSIAIGGFSKGVTVLNMTSAYAMIANDGEYIKPTFVKEVKDEKDNVVYKPKQKKKRMMSKENAFILKDILKSACAPGEFASQALVNGIDVGAKTGTSDEQKDSYLCAISNYYTAATWYGFDRAESYTGRGFLNPASFILGPIFKNIHEGVDRTKGSFVKPENVISVKICKADGKLFDDKCPDAFNEYFVKGTEPKEKSDAYIEVEVCKKTEKLAGPKCKDKIKKVYLKGQEPKEICKVCENEAAAEEQKNLEIKNKLIKLVNTIGPLNSYSLAQLKSYMNEYDVAPLSVKTSLPTNVIEKFKQIKQKINELEDLLDRTNAQRVVNAINALPAPASIIKANEPRVKNARNMYNSLRDSAKKYVTNLSKLVACEEKLKTL